MKLDTSLIILISVFGVYFTGFVSTYSVYAYKHKIKHPSPFLTIMCSEKKPCARVLEYGTYVSSVYASPLLLAGDTASDISGIYVQLTTPGFEKFGIASSCVLLFYRFVSSYQMFKLGGLKNAILQFSDILAIIEASASFSEGYLHYLFIWIAREEALLEAMPQLVITLISISPYERRKNLSSTSFYILIFSAILSYVQVVLKVYKNDEGSVWDFWDSGLVKYGRLALRGLEILSTVLLFVLLTYWNYLVLVLFSYSVLILSFYGYFWFSKREEDKMKRFKYRRNPPETKYIDRILLMGGDFTNLFVSVLCNPLFLPTRTGDSSGDSVIACFYCEGCLPQLLMRMLCFFPEYFYENDRKRYSHKLQINTSIFQYKRDYYLRVAEVEEKYLPFNFSLYVLRAILQVLCLATIGLSIIVSGISLNDEFWVYFAFGTIFFCILSELAILFGIEYAFQKPCGSTFNTEVAILTQNARMAKELLWLNTSPSTKVDNETLVSIAARDRSVSFPISLLKLILDNNFDANQRVDEVDCTVLMTFLVHNHEECVRHLWKVQSLDVDATDKFGRGLAHYAITNNLEFLKFMLNTMNVPFNMKDNYHNRAVLFGEDKFNLRRRHEISEDVLDWLIDEVGSPEDVYKKFGENILTKYIHYADIIQLHRVKYWIQKRGINPYDQDQLGLTAFDYIAGREQIAAEIGDYFQSLQHSIEM